MLSAIYCDRRFLTRYDAAACLLLFFLAIAVAFTYGSYGFTTDETVDHIKAVRVLSFLSSFGGNRDEITNIDHINIYGAMPDVLALLLQKLVPTLSFDSRHFVSALFGVIGIYYLYRLGRAFISPAVGFFGALFLACNPMWFGYMFFDAKDIPFAAMLLVALYYCLNAMTGRYKSGWLLPFMMVIAAYPIGLILTLRPSLVVRIATPVIVLIAMIPTLVSMYQLF